MKAIRICYGLAWIVLLLSALSLIHKITLNSDTLFLDNLTTDVFSNNGLWADWRLTPAPAYLPDMLLYFIGYKFFASVTLRIFFVSFCQVFMLAFLSLWLAKKIHPQLSTTAKTAIILILAFVTLVATHSGMWLYFYTTNNHFSALVFSLLILDWLLTFVEQPSLWLGLIIIFASAIAKASSEIFIISFLLPVVITCLFILLTIAREKVLAASRISIVTIIGLLLFSLGLAHIIDWIFTYHSPLNNRVPMSIDAADHSFVLFLQSLKIAFSPYNLYTFTLSLFIFLTFTSLIIRALLNNHIHFNPITHKTDGVLLPLAQTETGALDWKLNVCYLLLLFMVPINLLGAIGSGGFADTAGARYFITPIALGILLFVIAFDRTLGKSDRALKIYQISILFTLLILTILTIKTGKMIFHQNSLSNLTEKSYPDDQNQTKVANCLEHLIQQKVPLNAGIADYWFTRGVMVHIHDNIPIEATLNDLTPFFWMSTAGPYIHPERYTPRTYNFIIVRSNSDADPFDYHAQTLSKVVPKGYTQFTCADTGVTIWFYPNNQLDKIVKNKQYQLISTSEFQNPQGFCKVVNRC